MHWFKDENFHSAHPFSTTVKENALGNKNVSQTWEVWFKETRKESVPSLDKRFTVHALTGQTREKQEGEWCWTECEKVDKFYVQHASIRTRRREIWTVNMGLKNYYDAVTGLPGFVADGATVAGAWFFTTDSASSIFAYLGLEGLIGATWSTGGVVGGFTLVEGAAVGASYLSVGLLVFETFTYLSDAFITESEKLVSDAWVIDELESTSIEYGPPIHERDGIPYWERCGPIRRCNNDIDIDDFLTAIDYDIDDLSTAEEGKEYHEQKFNSLRNVLKILKEKILKQNINALNITIIPAKFKGHNQK